MPLLQTKVFVSSRSKTAWMLLLSLAFVAIAVFLPPDGRSEDWRYYCGGFSGLCAAVFTWLLIRPQRILFDTEGFTLCGGLIRPSTERKIPWRDIDAFFLYRTGRGHKMIGLNFVEGARERTKFTRFNRRTLGVDGSLPGMWPGGVEQMVQELNDYRASALAISDRYGSSLESAGSRQS